VVVLGNESEVIAALVVVGKLDGDRLAAAGWVRVARGDHQTLGVAAWPPSGVGYPDP